MSDKAAIADLEAGRARAILEADVAWLKDMTDPDYIHVEATGQRRNREDFLAALASGKVRFTRYDVLENDIRIVDDVAIVSGIFQNEIEGTDVMCRQKRGRHCRIYIRRGDRWANILHQGTQIAG